MSPAAGIVAPVDALVDRMGSLDGRFLLVALAFQVGNLAFRALAWRSVLAAAYPDRRIPLFTVGAAYTAGMALNAFVPARGGEALKVALVRARLGGSSTATVAASGSVVLVLDAVVGASLFAAAWAAGAVPGVRLPVPGAPALAAGAVPTSALCAGLVALAALALLLRRAIHALRRIGAELVRGLSVLRSPARYFGTVVPFQLAAWACRIGFVLFLLAAFGLPATLAAAALVVVLGGLSTLVPVTPGGAGTQQALVVLALHESLSTAQALSFSVSMQVGVTILNTFVGLTATMLLLRTARPLAAARAALRTARDS